MHAPPPNELMDIFNEPTFAWELLQWEIAIEMNEALTGPAIARLLELYMKGVERMNSKMDIREAYFKNKVTGLMMKNTVVKTLNKPPMAKKQKPLEASAKKQTKRSSKTTEVKSDQKLEKAVVEPQSVNLMAIQERRREIEMRLAYESEASSRQHLATLYNQHVKKEESFNNKVKNILNSYEENLRERISRRRLKTSTNRSRPEDTNDTFSKQIDEKYDHLKKEIEDVFAPEQYRYSHQKVHKVRKCHSLQRKADNGYEQAQMGKKERRRTYDHSELNELISFSQKHKWSEIKTL